MKQCVLYDRVCIECGECDRCDLDPERICDNCMRCVNADKDYNAVLIEGVEQPERAKNAPVERGAGKLN